MTVQNAPDSSFSATCYPKIDKSNRATFFRHKEGIHGITILIYYVFGAVNFIPYHEKDKLLSCISYLCSQDLKFWYVANSVSRISFGRLVLSSILHKDSVNYRNDTRNRIRRRWIFFSTIEAFLDDKSVAVRISRNIQEEIKWGNGARTVSRRVLLRIRFCKLSQFCRISMVGGQNIGVN